MVGLCAVISLVPFAGYLYRGDKQITHRPLRNPALPLGRWQFRRCWTQQAYMRPRRRRSASIPLRLVLGPPSCQAWHLPGPGRFAPAQLLLHRSLSLRRLWLRSLSLRNFSASKPLGRKPPDMELRPLATSSGGPLNSFGQGGSVLQPVLWYILYCLGIPLN